MTFTFGAQTASTSQTTTTQPFSFGSTAKTSAPTLSLTTSVGSNPPAGGFSFGLNKTTAPTNLFGTPAATTSVGMGGGLTQATTSATGFSFGAPTSSAASGFSLGKPATSAAPLLGQGLLGSAPATSSTLGGGSLFPSSTSTLGVSSAPSSSIFSSVPATSANVGLGGLDPNTALKQAYTGAGDASSSPSDGKTVKESFLPEQLAATVDSLQKFVKDEKTVREDIARMSSKPMMKVQEDVMALRQLLSVVANGLQRNACSVDKLKQEMTQKLKNAEMAQRTKDIPAGLQYENTAPTEYFQHLVEDFEDRMVTYRQQIETLDSHLTALHQPSTHSPAEIIALLKKLHETFISLAAQLQVIHETVKAQKDQFLTYRRVFYGDGKNIFHKPSPAPKPVVGKKLSDLAGPTPFSGITNAAAHAMALVHARSQQPQGPPVTGLTAGGSFGTSGFGSTGIFASSKPAQGSSLGGIGCVFSSTGPGFGGFGSQATQGSSTTAALNLAETNLNMSANTKQPFQLQKPPPGAKRGKR